jgi:hypothetical protein
MPPILTYAQACLPSTLDGYDAAVGWCGREVLDGMLDVGGVTKLLRGGGLPHDALPAVNKPCPRPSMALMLWLDWVT